MHPSPLSLNAPPVQPPGGPGPDGKVRMIITYDPSNGRLEVTGPIEEQVMAYGMLEFARYSIDNHNRAREAASARKVMGVPAGVPLPPPPGSRG